MTLSFNYKSVKRPDGTEVKIPSIPILIHGEENIDTIGLLDSGADISAISKDFAELLGLNLKGKKSPAWGIGGKVDAVDTKMNITIEKGHEHYNFQIPVKVILDDYDFVQKEIGKYAKIIREKYNYKNTLNMIFEALEDNR